MNPADVVSIWILIGVVVFTRSLGRRPTRRPPVRRGTPLDMPGAAVDPKLVARLFAKERDVDVEEQLRRATGGRYRRLRELERPVDLADEVFQVDGALERRDALEHAGVHGKPGLRVADDRGAVDHDARRVTTSASEGDRRASGFFVAKKLTGSAQGQRADAVRIQVVADPLHEDERSAARRGRR